MCERRKLINQYAEGEALPRHFDLVFVPAADEWAGVVEKLWQTIRLRVYVLE